MSVICNLFEHNICFVRGSRFDDNVKSHLICMRCKKRFTLSEDTKINRLKYILGIIKKY